MHDFWSVLDPMQRVVEMTSFMKNMALAGATLMLLAVPEPWVGSLSRRQSGA
jgi:hypothetical protein